MVALLLQSLDVWTVHVIMKSKECYKPLLLFCECDVWPSVMGLTAADPTHASKSIQKCLKSSKMDSKEFRSQSYRALGAKSQNSSE